MRQQEQQIDRTEVVRSEPVPVPQPDGGAAHPVDTAQRTGVPEDAIDDRGSFDAPQRAEHHDPDREHHDRNGTRLDRDHEHHDRDDAHLNGAAARTDDVEATTADGPRRDDVDQPAPVPTAFGATTVGGAVAASALASPVPAAEPDPRQERTARPGDGAVGQAGDDRRADPTSLLNGHHRAQTVDEAEPAGLDRVGGPAGTATSDSLATAGSTGATEENLTGPAALFDRETAQGFQDRWRDVQLRFVDDPKAAAGQAQGLVEEAIQALAAALAEQKNRISDWRDDGSADTEQLRQAVRGYRDFLNRVLGR